MSAIPQQGDLDRDWWSSLTHGGLLIAPARLGEFFGTAPAPLSLRIEERLRREITRVREDEKYIGPFLDTLLEQVLGLAVTVKEAGVEKQWSRKLLTGESYRPNRLWLGMHGDVFPIFIVRARGETSTPRLRVGRGRRDVSKVTEWLRLADQPVGLLTNGRQFLLIHAGADYSAWCEWDVDQWLEGGIAGLQVEAFRRLLGVKSIASPTKGSRSPLVEAILASRRGQAQLSAALGERVRQAVETLIRASGQAIDPLLAGIARVVPRTDELPNPGSVVAKPAAVTPNDVYIAATRIVMRLVVVLFAEARDLLPRDNPVYHRSYGLQGLREELARSAGGRAERLRHRFSAWPRLLGLFRLVAKGSGHEELPIPAYGGGLFELGKAASADGVSCALAAFESPGNILTDETVRAIIDLLTMSPVKVRQGRGATTVMSPVNFSDLSSEYIGILYEGLLDFELRRVPDGDTFVFLNVGDEPVLPMSRLEKMDEKALKSLFEKLKAKPSSDDGDNGDEDEEDLADAEAEPDDSDSELTEQPISNEDDVYGAAKQRVSKWAKKAVVAAGLVKARRGREPEAADAEAAQKVLVKRVLASGEWFLVRWGGTRKGAGTFYTRPQLAGPTARRTLQPLAYNVVKEAKDERTGLMEPTEWAPKKPEEILALKVCDPAMGSGSFLVSALRFLSQALMESLFHHGRLESKGDDRTICRLADGAVAGHPREELLPVPKDDPGFEAQLVARLKRHVVEVCIYGVDIDPVAVELARLSLWIETMNRELPFEFLDHKLKEGNSLVGCWFDRFQDYPIAAWEREGGDKAHDRPVHHFHEVTSTRGKTKGQTNKAGDKWTHAIAQFAADQVYPELAAVIREQFQPSFVFGTAGASAADVHAEAQKTLEQMQRLAVHEVDRRAELYATGVRDNEAIKQLRRQFDAWCAIWFWPGDRVADAPTPKSLHKLTEDVALIVDEVARNRRFFHWELEFPDVFTRSGGGFDAIIGNPPWDIQKPNSKEFFSNFDPLYRAYGKQEALDVQEELFTGSMDIELRWVRYQAQFKALSNWTKHVGHPFGDPAEASDGKGLSLARGGESTLLHSTWRQLRKRRKGFTDPAHPFVHQGSADLNTYKMFLETAHALLRADGQLGLIVPSGVYTDKGTTELRNLFLNQCRWHWLFGFENREGIFDIDSRFKFAPIVIQKGGTTVAFRAAFMRRKLEDWEHAQDYVLAYPRERVEQFSPKSLAILELSSPRDLEVLTKLYTNGVLLGDDGPEGWGISYAREFDMTNDSKLFPPRARWEDRGYIPDEYGHWLKGGWKEYRGPRGILERKVGLVLSRDGSKTIAIVDVEDVALPLYQGVMLHQFDFSFKGFVAGGRGRWDLQPWLSKQLSPQFLMGRRDFVESGKHTGVRVGFRDIARATDVRTMIAAPLPPLPSGNKVPLLSTSRTPELLAAVLNSFTFDWVQRLRQGSTSINWHIIAEQPLPVVKPALAALIGRIAFGLCAPHPVFAPAWMPHRTLAISWRRLWRVTPHERLRSRALLDALVAYAWGLTAQDLLWLLRDTDWQNPDRMNLDPRGFWRVDKGQGPGRRLTTLSIAAMEFIEGTGVNALLENDASWELPMSLDELGGRLSPEQQKESISRSWDECEQHAAVIVALNPSWNANLPFGARSTGAQLSLV